MIDRRKQLEQLTTNQLMDAVKNYRQYGYDDDVRDCAIAILEERGVHKGQLALSGNLRNDAFERATDLYNSFSKNTTIALISYFAVPIVGLLAGLTDSLFLTIIVVLSVFVFFIFFIKSFLNKWEFDKIVSKYNNETGSTWVYWFIGVWLFFVLYFYYRGHMKEQIKYLQ